MKKTLSSRIMRVMALFTGLQSFTIVCSIVKMKVVALWLQTSGVGLFGIYNSAIETISTLTDLGLRQSTVRDVAANLPPSGLFTSALARVVSVVRRWSVFSGVLGAVIVSGLCIPLSQWFFADTAHWWQFALLSFGILVNATINGEYAILQGTSRLKLLARCSLLSAIFGLVISIPLFYFCGLDSVVYSILAYAAAAIAVVGVLRLRIPKGLAAKPTVRECIKEGGEFVKLGMLMAIAAFATNLCHMAFLAYLTHNSSMGEVGLYQAGVTLVIRYVGLIFTAVSMEYYPRLAANAFSKWRTGVFVAQEMKVLLMVITPVVLGFLLFRNLIVHLLYSSEFEAVIPFISWAILSCIFKATSWCMAFVVLARGDGRIYLFTEVFDSLAGLGLCILGYQLWGLAGIGAAYVAWYFCYTLLTGYIYKAVYGFSLPIKPLLASLLSLALCGGAYAILDYWPAWLSMPIIAITILAFLPRLYRLWKGR